MNPPPTIASGNGASKASTVKPSVIGSLTPKPIDLDEHNLGAAFLDHAMADFDKRDFDSSIAHFTDAIRLDPKNAELYGSRGTAYGVMGANGLALDDLTEAIRLDPKLAKAYRVRAMVYGNMGYNEAAIADFTEAIRLDPKCAPAYAERGTAYAFRGKALGIKGDNDKAIADFTEAIRLDPKNAEAYRECRGV